jgi:amidase
MTDKKISTFSNDILGNLDATAIAAEISKGSFTAQEAAAAAIKRAEQTMLSLGAIAYDMFENAKTFKTNPHSGALAGVPTFIKDNEDIAGTPKQIGTLAFKSKLSKRNSKFVDQYLSTGMNVLGKTTLPEFGLICSTENPKWAVTRNPWHTDYTTGGSSSGSAAMVASGVVSIAHANDGAGSTRIPASCCGLVGLKPSRNRLVNFEGSESLPINIGYQGVLTRSVRDTALFYAEAEKHFACADLPKMGHVTAPLRKRLKFVFFENLSADKLGFMDLDTQKAMEETANLLTSLGHIVEQKPFPLDVDNLSLFIF